MEEKKIMITGANGFIGKHLVHKLCQSGNKQQEQFVTLGKSSANDITVDLTTSAPEIINYKIGTLFHFAGSCCSANAHKENYILTQNLLKGLETNPPENIVFLSTTEVYGRTSGENWSEADIPDPKSPLGTAKLSCERLLQEYCTENNVTLTVLRLPMTIGTWMNGRSRKLVNRIHRGTYHHIAGNDARTSVVHVRDVVNAAIKLASTGGTFNITDAVDPTYHDLTEALAHRLNDKKIMTLRPKRAKRWALLGDFIPGMSFTSEELRKTTTTLTYSSEKIWQVLDFKPIDVTDFLLHHNYDSDEI